jgi:hypothetical protein
MCGGLLGAMVTEAADAENSGSQRGSDGAERGYVKRSIFLTRREVQAAAKAIEQLKAKK